MRRDGSLVEDFEYSVHERAVHVLNAASPAATASLAIGEEIAALALAQ
jgi:L-2-hydroxyglutarate oxidase LhgO